MKEIKHNDNGESGNFEIFYDGKPAGLIEYQSQDGSHIIITHTEVNEQYGGMGLGKDLVNTMADFAREKGLKINPLCPFAKKVMTQDPQLQELIG